MSDDDLKWLLVIHSFFLLFNDYLSITYLEPVTTSNAEVAENNNK